MSYTVKFKTNNDALRFAMFYNGARVRKFCKEARKMAEFGKPLNEEGFRFWMCFTGIQGKPVTVIYNLMKKKGYAI